MFQRRFVCSLSAAALLSLGLASSAYAGGPGPYNDPQHVQHFSLWGEGLYATQSKNHLMMYPATTTNAVPVGKTSGKIGFTVGGRYTTNHNSDMSLEYTRYKPTWSTDTYEGLSQGLNDSYKYSGSDEYQAINWDVGQTWNPFGKFNLRAFAGLGWRAINSAYQDYTSKDSAYNHLKIGVYPVKTWGIGPRVGFDGAYHYKNWLSFVAGGSLTLPYGERTMPELIFNSSKINSYNYKTFLPELAGNLALQFTYQKNAAWSVLLQGGYRVVHVFNATVNVTRMASSHINSTAHLDITSEGITWAGPYVRLGVSF